LCARSGEKPALAQSSPLNHSQGHVSRRGAQAGIAWRKVPRDAVDVTWKRNGGEHAWPFFWTGRGFDISSTKCRCRGCIGREQTADKRDRRPKNASTDPGLSDVDIPDDQSSRWQKLAAVPEETFEREARGKTRSLFRLVNSLRSEVIGAKASRAALIAPYHNRVGSQ
jgi:hypothetical protein